MALNHTMTRREWTMLLVLALLWGGTFFFIGVSLPELPPITLVALRVSLSVAICSWFRGVDWYASTEARAVGNVLGRPWRLRQVRSYSRLRVSSIDLLPCTAEHPWTLAMPSATVVLQFSAL